MTFRLCDTVLPFSVQGVVTSLSTVSLTVSPVHALMLSCQPVHYRPLVLLAILPSMIFFSRESSEFPSNVTRTRHILDFIHSKRLVSEVCEASAQNHLLVFCTHLIICFKFTFLITTIITYTAFRKQWYILCLNVT